MFDSLKQQADSLHSKKSVQWTSSYKHCDLKNILFYTGKYNKLNYSAFWLVLTYCLLADRHADDVIIIFVVSKLYQKLRFHIAVHLFCNRLKKMLKCGDNTGDMLNSSRAAFLSLQTTFWHALWSITKQMHSNMESILLIRCKSPYTTHLGHVIIGCYSSSLGINSTQLPFIITWLKLRKTPCVTQPWQEYMQCYR